MMDQMELLLRRYPQLAPCAEEIGAAYALLERTYAEKHKVLACGNGGSAADAAHIVGELMKAFVLERPLGAAKQLLRQALPPEDAEYLAGQLQGALPAISLHGELALVSAYANDVAPDLVFAQQVLGLGVRGDCLIAISTSGNSSNVAYAVKTAKALGLVTVGLTGRSGGKLHELCDVCIRVPEDETYKIQELHLPVYHALCLALEQRFFGE